MQRGEMEELLQRFDPEVKMAATPISIFIVLPHPHPHYYKGKGKGAFKLFNPYTCITGS